MNALKISITIQLPWLPEPITYNRELPSGREEDFKFLNAKTRRQLLGNLVAEFLLITTNQVIARIQEEQSRED